MEGSHTQSTRNVERALLSPGRKKRHRRPGDIPYPASHSSELLDVETWDHIFRKACLRNRLTFTPRSNPPSRVLDLGCGSGLWVLEAAKEWPKCRLWGYDILKVQPHCLSAIYDPSISHRVTWVHGNFLEGLPFESGFFDFVRITLIGLGVPEDEWQDLLEEVHRVMQPGASLELFEEDLIFPSVETSPPAANTGKPQLHLDISQTEGSIRSSQTPTTPSSRSTATLFSDNSVSSWEEEVLETPLSKKPGLSPLLESPIDDAAPPKGTPSKEDLAVDETLTLTEPSSIPFPWTRITPPLPLPPLNDPPSPSEALRLSHSRLKRAWEAMLNRRFISPSLVSVMPFYISTVFADVVTHPAVEIELPKNSSGPRRRSSTISGSRQSVDSEQSGFGAPQNDVQYLDSVNIDDSHSQWSEDNETINEHTAIRPDHQRSPTSLPAWAPLHLAKCVRTVTQCKDAIWREYAELFRSSLPPPIARTINATSFLRKPSLPSTREAFEHDWKTWENDMLDRIEMRNHITAQIPWPEPITERPDWRVWRHNTPENALAIPDPTLAPPLCRSMRAFRATKGSSGK